jgi:hypothetical protein
MIKVKGYITTGFAGATHEEYFEFEEDVMEAEINSVVEDWAYNKIEIGWTKVEESE